jgi:hypothetical protein
MYQGLSYDFKALVKMVEAAGLMQSVCTIQAPSQNVGSSGAPDGTYSNVAGLVSLPCMNAPESTGGIVANEVKSLAEILSMSLRHVLLNGYYAQLDGQNWGAIGWRAMLDGVAYDILAAERDSQFSQTRLKLRLVTV